jgi:hypothetical protein
MDGSLRRDRRPRAWRRRSAGPRRLSSSARSSWADRPIRSSPEPAASRRWGRPASSYLSRPPAVPRRRSFTRWRPLLCPRSGALGAVPATHVFLSGTSWGWPGATGQSLSDALKVPVTRYRKRHARRRALTGLARIAHARALRYVPGRDDGGQRLHRARSSRSADGARSRSRRHAPPSASFRRSMPDQARGALSLPPQALLMLPYVLSLAALACARGGARPADLGKTA